MFQHANVHPNNGITKKRASYISVYIGYFCVKNALYRLIFVPDRDYLNEDETE